MRILIAFLIVCSACSSSVTSTYDTADSTSTFSSDAQTISITTEHTKGSIDRSKLFGAWTDGSTENATFDISKDTIFYLDAMTAFPYTLIGDTMIIEYPDFIVRASIHFSGDTLVLSDPEFGRTKYTRFQD